MDAPHYRLARAAALALLAQLPESALFNVALLGTAHGARLLLPRSLVASASNRQLARALLPRELVAGMRGCAACSARAPPITSTMCACTR